MLASIAGYLSIRFATCRLLLWQDLDTALTFACANHGISPVSSTARTTFSHLSDCLADIMERTDPGNGSFLRQVWDNTAYEEYGDRRIVASQLSAAQAGVRKTEPFPYKQLRGQDIRLVEVESRRDGGLLRCRMFTAPLSRSTRYHALSYVWGKPGGEQYEILVNDWPVKVTRNLYEFLDQIWEEQYKLRRKYPSTHDEYEDAITMWPEPLHWWIDALCINQNDTLEKSQQVPRMGHLYSCATRVWVWFGQGKDIFPSKPESAMFQLTVTNHFLQGLTDRPAVPISEHLNAVATSIAAPAFADHIMLRMVCDRCLQDSRSAQEREVPEREVVVESLRAGLTVNEIRKAAGFEPISEADISLSFPHETTHSLLQNLLRQLDQFMRNDWFQRTWTLQEYLLSRDEPIALIGQFSFYLPGLLRLCMEVSNERESMEPTLHNTTQILLPRFQKVNNLVTASEWMPHPGFRRLSSSHNLLRLLSLFSDKQSTMKHDHVYGLLGLLEAPLPKAFEPDYHLPYEKVCQNYAAYMLRSTGDLKVIEAHDSDIKGCPSWVPDFAYLDHIRTLPLPNTTTTGSVSFSEDGERLHVEGVRIGAIERCSCDLGLFVDAAEHLRFIGVEILERSAKLRGEDPADVYSEWLRTIMNAEIALPERIICSYLSIDALIEAYLEIISPMPPEVRQKLARIRLDDFAVLYRSSITNAELLHAILMICHFKYCVLETGEILECHLKHLNNNDHHLNDSVWALRGCQNLSILRTKSNGHEYVGRCQKQNPDFTFEKMKEHYTAHGVDGPHLSAALLLNSDYFANKVLEEVVIV